MDYSIFELYGVLCRDWIYIWGDDGTLPVMTYDQQVDTTATIARIFFPKPPWHS